MKRPAVLLLVSLILAACGGMGEPLGPGMGMGNDGMMARHHAEIPAEYAGLTNPLAADDESLARGAELYAANCASCHGEGGLGDGPAGAALDPQPAPVSHTSQMMADDYLFWRISEGGLPFDTAMPVWKDTLDEQARWDLINHIRALGAGQDPASQAARQDEMLAKAVEQGVVTEEEAEIFRTVHGAMEQYRVEHPEAMGVGETAAEREAAILAALVSEQIVAQEQADAFQEIHDRLGASGLMP